MTLGWGIAATGRIAREVGAVIAAHPDMTVAAVGSRELARAAELAAELGGTPHGSYAALVHDPAVEAVYVTTPHPLHAQVVELALAAGKAVLCEKPLTASLAETERLVALAEASGTFLMEAVWTRFNPLVQQLKALSADGTLGAVRSVAASLGFAAEYDAAGRLWSPELGGGALLDLGIYPVDFARLLLGDPSSVYATGSLAATGVDDDVALLLTFPGGARALLEATLLYSPRRTGLVTGTLGSALIGPSFHAPTSLVVEVDGQRTEHSADRLSGYRGELEEVARCRAEGRTQSDVLPLSETVATMRVLAAAGDQVAAAGTSHGPPR